MVMTITAMAHRRRHSGIDSDIGVVGVAPLGFGR
jgi:hypothetical protein